MKGDFDCRCNCCAYWRRRMHKIAANGDKEKSKVLARLKRLARVVCYKDCRFNSLSVQYRALSKKLHELENKNKPGILSRMLGLS